MMSEGDRAKSCRGYSACLWILSGRRDWVRLWGLYWRNRRSRAVHSPDPEG
jgi:hypothetical protein